MPNYFCRREQRAPYCGQGHSKHPRVPGMWAFRGSPRVTAGRGTSPLESGSLSKRQRAWWVPAAGPLWTSSSSGSPLLWGDASLGPRPFQAGSQALCSQPQRRVQGGMGPTPGQSPNLPLSCWEIAFFLQDLGLPGCGPGAEGGWRPDMATAGGQRGD